MRVKSVTNGKASLGDRRARFAQRPVSSGGAESAQASMRPERGARPAGREQSVTRGHRCLSFTLGSPKQRVASNLATRQQKLAARQRKTGPPFDGVTQWHLQRQTHPHGP